MKLLAIRDHLSLFWSVYATFLAILIALFYLSGVGIRRTQEISKWPNVTALIVESKVSEDYVASETSADTRLTAKLLLQYDVGKRAYRTAVVRNWTRRTQIDFTEVFGTGKNLEIRYNPNDPNEVSLFPLLK